MKTSLVSSALLLTTLTSAWPVWPRWLPELDSLVVRQDSKSSSSSVTPTAVITSSQASQTGSSQSGSASQTGSSDSSDSTSQSGASTTNTAKITGSSSSGSNSKTPSTTVKHSTAFDPRLPAGGIAMITPAVLSGSQYFKIGDYVTFAWNYTSLLATPSYINVMATCTAAEQLYTIAANQTVGNATGAVTWDTGAYQQTALSDPLLTDIYTLIIYDAESSISATAEAGYLAVYNQYQFGMYTPQPYTPLGEFKCATCSGALGDMERRALGMVVGVSIVTVLSFTWFVAGMGVIW